MFNFRNVVTALMLLLPISSLAVTATVDDVKLIARLYSAAFDRNPKVDGLNFWVETFESGKPIVEIARKFYESPEFTKKYGPLTNVGYVEQLYRNVLLREGNQTGVDFWEGHLVDGVSRAKVLAEFADSPENVVKTAERFEDMRLRNGLWVFERIRTVGGLVSDDLGALRMGCTRSRDRMWGQSVRGDCVRPDPEAGEILSKCMQEDDSSADDVTSGPMVRTIGPTSSRKSDGQAPRGADSRARYRDCERQPHYDG